MTGTVSVLYYHVVIGTRNRRPVIDDRMKDDLYGYLKSIVRAHGGLLVEAGAAPDHIHLVLQLHPEHAVADTVRVIKNSAARWIIHRAGLYDRPLWQPGFAALSVGRSEVATVAHSVGLDHEKRDGPSYPEEILQLLRSRESFLPAA